MLFLLCCHASIQPHRDDIIQDHAQKARVKARLGRRSHGKDEPPEFLQAVPVEVEEEVVMEPLMAHGQLVDVYGRRDLDTLGRVQAAHLVDIQKCCRQFVFHTVSACACSMGKGGGGGERNRVKINYRSFLVSISGLYLIRRRTYSYNTAMTVSSSRLSVPKITKTRFWRSKV